MNLIELLRDADRKLDTGEITIGEYEKMIAPLKDAVPVRHGRWVHHPEIGWGSTWLCSECGEKTVETVMGEPRYKFCPMCGARMDLKDGGNENKV